MNGLTKQRAIVYLLAVFVAGLIAGGAGGYALGIRQMFRPPPGNMAERIMDTWKRELALTQDQIGQLEPIARETAAAMEAMHEEGWGRVRETFRQTNLRVEQYLTPEQCEQLRALEARHEKKMPRNPGPPPPRSPDGPESKPH
ncbi:MAG: hypothetical protein ACYC23_12430 [Limisphaerales bacterium]